MIEFFQGDNILAFSIGKYTIAIFPTWFKLYDGVPHGYIRIREFGPVRIIGG